MFYCEDDRVEISNMLTENALRCVALGRNNAQPEVMRSPSLSKNALRVAEAIRKDSRFGELRIITATPGTAGCGPVVDIDDSLLRRLNPVQRLLLHCQISFHIAMCCRWAFVSQPQGDDREVDA